MSEGVNLLASFIGKTEPEKENAGQGGAPHNEGEPASEQKPKEKRGSGTKAAAHIKTEPKAKTAPKSKAAAAKKPVQEEDMAEPAPAPAKRGRKKLEDPEDLTQISIRISKDLYRRIRMYLAVADEKESMTKLVRESLESYLDEHGG